MHDRERGWPHVTPPWGKTEYTGDMRRYGQCLGRTLDGTKQCVYYARHQGDCYFGKDHATTGIPGVTGRIVELLTDIRALLERAEKRALADLPREAGEWRISGQGVQRCARCGGMYVGAHQCNAGLPAAP